MRDEQAIETLVSLYNHDWSIHDLGEFLLVDDTATRYFIEAADITAELMDGAEPNPEWYEKFCGHVDGIHSADVPQSTRRAACELLGCSADDLTYGW